LRDVYSALELEWDEATAGSVADEAPGVDEDAVERAVIAAYRERFELVEAELDADTAALARRLEPDHHPEAYAPQRRRARSIAD
jgi:hypothetical protein